MMHCEPLFTFDVIMTPLSLILFFQAGHTTYLSSTPKMDSSHPLWKDRVAKVLHPECFPMQGVKQAQLFSNSVQIKTGLPDSILDLSHLSKIKEEDSLVQK